MELKQHFLLKVTDYMSEGQTEKYLGRFITRIATGFSIKCNPALIASMAELLGLSGLTTAVPTPVSRLTPELKEKKPWTRPGPSGTAPFAAS